MDITISPSKSQTLALISCTPFCHSHSSSSLPSSNLASIRREFLGCGYKLRPQGLRTRRKFKNLRFHIHSPRFLFRASLNSQIAAVFVVAMATLSAISIAYFNYSKRKKDGKEVSGASNLIFSQLVRDIMGYISKDHKVSIFGDVGKETTPKECKVLASEEIDDSHVCNHSDASWHSQESALIYEEDVISKVPEPPSADVLASIAIDYRSSEESEIVGLSTVPPGLSNSGVQQPHIFATKMSKLQTEVVVKEAEYISELPMLMVNFKSSAAPVPVNELRTELNEYRKPNYELGEGGKSTDDSGFFGDPVRKELHMFYEENQYVKTSLVNMNGAKTSSFNASLLESNTLSSVIRDNILRGADVSAQDSLSTAEYAEQNVPYAYYKEDSFRRRRNLGKSRGIQSDTGRRILPQKVHDIPYPNGVHVNKKRDSSDEFSDYYRLLRQGRLTDCIEWLEYMERLGLLDTNKVYHAKFFETCKNQRAVKEAFRFIKMIPNPSLSTFNMLMSVCASSQDSEGAFQVLRLAQEAGLKADCKLYTTLISTCAKCGKVDAMFEVFHEMVNAKVEPNVHTYGALIDGCAKAGQVAKAFGAYGIMRSKKVKPDRVIFNALITACGQSGAVDRAFDVLAEMGAETQPIDPDHVTVGALIKACINAGQVDRARKVYKMIDQYNIKGTPEVYTIALNSCSQTGDWEFACSVFSDMTRIGILPDEMFLSALIDVAGHAGKLDEAFEVLREARTRGLCVGIVSYSSLMGACSNAKNWEKALELYEDIKSMKLKPTVSTMNALITALCDGDQLEKAMEVLSDMTREGLCPNTITYSILLVASEKKDDIESCLTLRSDAKKDGFAPVLLMCRCLIGMCLRRFEKACILGEPVLSFNSGRPQIDNEWTSLALMVYRETIAAGVTPSMEIFSHVLGCLQLPHEASLRSRLIENLDVITDTSKSSNLFSLIDGFGEYDPRAFSLLEEAASLGIVPCVPFKQSPILVDARNLQIHTAEVYLLTVLKGLKHRLAAGARLPNISILVPVEKTKIVSPKGEKTIILAGKTSQAVAACLRRLRLPYQGGESYGKIRINGIVVKRWFQPKLASPFSGKPVQLSSSQSRLGKAITYQQRDIRTENLSME